MGDAFQARAATPEGAEPDKRSPASLASTIAEESLGVLAWIIQQAEGAMAISAGASQTSGDPEGALQMLNSIASDIAINAEMLSEKITAGESK